jgi:hypothetical protein
MADEKNHAALLADLLHFRQALLLKRRIAYRQDFIQD